jgi:hypothetical protein
VAGAIRIEPLVLPGSQVASPVAARHFQRRWKPTSPLLRAASAVVGHWEQRVIDPGQGHLHGTDIRDQETPPTRNGSLDCLRIIPLDRKKVKELRW